MYIQLNYVYRIAGNKISKVVKLFENIFFGIKEVIMHVHFQNVLYGPWIMALFKYFKHIKACKEGRSQSVLPKPDCSLACLMLSSAIEAANS